MKVEVSFCRMTAAQGRHTTKVKINPKLRRAKTMQPGILLTLPKNIFHKPITVSWKPLFVAMTAGIAHAATAKWDDLAKDAAEAISALGLSTAPEELAFLLVKRSITAATFALVRDSMLPQLIETEDANKLQSLDLDVEITDIPLDRDFFTNPQNNEVVHRTQAAILKWLAAIDLPHEHAAAIANRFPAYFISALTREWRIGSKNYKAIQEAVATPFTAAGEREWAWDAYIALLQRRTQEGMFDESYSLRQLYVPPCGYCYDTHDTAASAVDSISLRRPVAIDVGTELHTWVGDKSPTNSLKVLSGGPGSGKSSLARIFSADVAAARQMRVLFVPLHLLDTMSDLVDEVGRFVKSEGILPHNPLAPDTFDGPLLIVFDGLDELASQGQASAETARSFVREVERTLERINHSESQLKVLISGREVAIQENEAEFRRPRQVVTLLPFFHDKSDPSNELSIKIDDPGQLRAADRRQEWWQKYGQLTGLGFTGLPEELDRAELHEITGQPLLNYLVALSYTRKKVDFSGDVNVNSIYADLVAAVHERAYEKRRVFRPIRHMTVDEFVRVLEEIGLAAWHGDGRSTTVREIEDHCRNSGLGRLLDVFQEGAKVGVTRLLAAFFFRQYGQRQSGDPTFVFTHKSFGEYLAARRVVRATERMVRELRIKVSDPDAGWDERDALKHWMTICGPSEMTLYLHRLVTNQVAISSLNNAGVNDTQSELAALFSGVLTHGMPSPDVTPSRTKDTIFMATNAETSLFAVMQAYARITGKISNIEHHSREGFGGWYRRTQGQRVGADPGIVGRCLTKLNMQGAVIDIGDFYSADLSHSIMDSVKAHFACFDLAFLLYVQARKATFSGARFEKALLIKSDFSGSDMREAFFLGANCEEVNFSDCRLLGSDMRGCALKGAVFRNAVIDGADFSFTNLEGVDFTNVQFESAVFEGTRIQGVIADPRTRAKLQECVEGGRNRKGRREHLRHRFESRVRGVVARSIDSYVAQRHL